MNRNTILSDIASSGIMKSEGYIDRKIERCPEYINSVYVQVTFLSFIYAYKFKFDLYCTKHCGLKKNVFNVFCEFKNDQSVITTDDIIAQGLKDLADDILDENTPCLSQNSKYTAYNVNKLKIINYYLVKRLDIKFPPMQRLKCIKFVWVDLKEVCKTMNLSFDTIYNSIKTILKSAVKTGLLKYTKININNTTRNTVNVCYETILAAFSNPLKSSDIIKQIGNDFNGTIKVIDDSLVQFNKASAEDEQLEDNNHNPEQNSKDDHSQSNDVIVIDFTTDDHFPTDDHKDETATTADMCDDAIDIDGDRESEESMTEEPFDKRQDVMEDMMTLSVHDNKGNDLMAYTITRTCLHKLLYDNPFVKVDGTKITVIDACDNK